MVVSPKKDELREGPLAVDMADLSEDPTVLDTMILTSILEPQAELELCVLSPFAYISGSSLKEGMHALTNLPLPPPPFRLTKNASVAWADEKLLDSASILLKDFLDETGGLQTIFNPGMWTADKRMFLSRHQHHISVARAESGTNFVPLDDLGKQQWLCCPKTAVCDCSGSWELTAAEQEKLPLAPFY